MSVSEKKNPSETKPKTAPKTKTESQSENTTPIEKTEAKSDAKDPMDQGAAGYSIAEPFVVAGDAVLVHHLLRTSSRSS